MANKKKCFCFVDFKHQEVEKTRGEVEVALQEVEETAGEVGMVAPTPLEVMVVDKVVVNFLVIVTDLHKDIEALETDLEITPRAFRQVCFFQ